MSRMMLTSAKLGTSHHNQSVGATKATNDGSRRKCSGFDVTPLKSADNSRRLETSGGMRSLCSRSSQISASRKAGRRPEAREHDVRQQAREQRDGQQRADEHQVDVRIEAARGLAGIFRREPQPQDADYHHQQHRERQAGAEGSARCPCCATGRTHPRAAPAVPRTAPPPWPDDRAARSSADPSRRRRIHRPWPRWARPPGASPSQHHAVR